ERQVGTREVGVGDATGSATGLGLRRLVVQRDFAVHIAVGAGDVMVAHDGHDGGVDHVRGGRGDREGQHVRAQAVDRADVAVCDRGNGGGGIELDVVRALEAHITDFAVGEVVADVPGQRGGGGGVQRGRSRRSGDDFLGEV